MTMDGAAHDDPIAWFRDSFERAARGESFDPARAALATADARGVPSVRFVLVRLVDARGFSFFTNLESRKARELAANPHASLAFHWASIGEQVRVEGRVERVSEHEADEYFASRNRGSQLSAWASHQSAEISSRAALERARAEVEQRFAGAPHVSRPPFWSGFRIAAERIELWHDRPDRLHDRWSFTRTPTAWSCVRLQP